MSLYKIDKEKLFKQRKIPFGFEKDIQKLVEKNLPTLFNLEFIASEVTYGKFRMDTLAYDQNLNSFVVIEYKNKADRDLIGQGLAYKGLFRKHPEFFILEYNKTAPKQKVDIKEIDWSSSRIIFISPEFTKYQEAIDFDDIPFEMWKIVNYDGGLISLEQLNPSLEKESNFDEINQKTQIRETVEYFEEQHLEKPTEEIKQLYFDLKKQILNLGEEIKLVPKKKYIAFKSATNFVDIDLQKSAIKCHLNLSFGELKDPNNMAKNVSNIGHYGNGDYEISITKQSEIQSLMNLIKQSYEKNK